MISNLKAKLSVMGSETSADKEQAVKPSIAPVKLFSNKYDLGAMVGDCPIMIVDTLKVDTISAVFREEIDSEISPEDMIFIDTETTGLSGGAGTQAFLIGVGYYSEGMFVVEQYMMNDFAGESEILKKLHDISIGRRYVVTYNGKSFDIPLITSRSIINRIRQPFSSMGHLDLLHAVRRQYKLRLGDCSLTNIESEILNLHRVDDIPGAMIPALFFEYMDSHDFEKMQAVVDHNRQDILTMPAILLKLCSLYEKPGDIEYLEDRYSLSRIYGSKDKDKMLQMLNSAMDLDEAKYDLAYQYKRSGEYEKALDLFKQLCATRFSHTAYVEIAKYYEHKTHEYQKAFNIVQSYLDRLLITMNEDNISVIRLKHRRDRLMNKISKSFNRKER